MLGSCGTGSDLNRSAVSDYSAEDLNIETDFQIFHTNADSSRFFIKLNTKSLLYTRGGNSGYTARVKVVITPYVLGDDAAFKLRSKTIRINDPDNEKEVKDLLAATDIALPEGKDYSIRIEITDVNRKRDITKFFLCDKQYPNSRHYFLAAESDIRIPKFGDRIAPGKAYIVKTNASKDRTVHVSRYKRNFPMPPPPFAYYEPRPFDYTPDSVFTVKLNSNNEFRFIAEAGGFYHFRNDPEQKEGYTLFVGHPDHPDITEAAQMAHPFRYLLSSKEFASILEEENRKKKIEMYWLDWCGNKERARAAIEAFYGRAEDANRYFSSHVDGWKTDRGLVYIVYGKPNKVYRSSTIETWIYGEENNPMSITFNFVKVINPFTANDFRLNREEYYKPTWYRSLEAWRNGRVY